MDTHGNVWCRDTTVPSVDQTHEACAKQESKETATDISDMEGSRPRDIGQSDNR